jgi:hypothetical protein
LSRVAGDLVQSKDQLNYKEKILRREGLVPSLEGNLYIIVQSKVCIAPATSVPLVA